MLRRVQRSSSNGNSPNRPSRILIEGRTSKKASGHEFFFSFCIYHFRRYKNAYLCSGILHGVGMRISLSRASAGPGHKSDGGTSLHHPQATQRWKAAKLKSDVTGDAPESFHVVSVSVLDNTQLVYKVPEPPPFNEYTW